MKERGDAKWTSFRLCSQHNVHGGENTTVTVYIPGCGNYLIVVMCQFFSPL